MDSGLISRIGALAGAPIVSATAGAMIGMAAAGPIGALVGGAASGTVAFGGTMFFARGRGFGLMLSRTRIDYRSEIGDPATNSIVGAVVGWVSRNFSEAPVRVVFEDSTELAYRPGPTGPGYMLRLLERPNEFFDGPTQWMATIVDWICRGNAYWIKIRNASDRVVQLWWVPERMMEPGWPKNDPGVFIGWYDYTVEGVTYRIPPRDVVHFRYGIDPSNPRKGLSRLASLFREIFTDEEAANFTASLLRNLGIPGVIIAPANTTGTTQVKAEPATVKQKFMETFGGDRRGEPMVLTSPTDVKVLSFNPQEMELTALRRIPEERIAAVIGIPVGVAQLGAGLDRNTFTNYGEARVAAYTEGVLPSHRVIAAQLELQLLTDFADLEVERLDVWFDWTKASAMASFAAEVWKRLESSATKGLITRAAFKRGTGQNTDASDEVYIYPSNYFVVSAGGNPPGGAVTGGARARAGYPELEAAPPPRQLTGGDPDSQASEQELEREELLATKTHREAEGLPAGYGTLARLHHMSVATVRRRLGVLD